MKWTILAIVASLIAVPARAQQQSSQNTVKGFLGYCGGDRLFQCSIIVSSNANDDPKCLRRFESDDDKEFEKLGIELAQSVVTWLAARPDIQNQEASSAIKTTLTALYSCKLK